MRGEVGVDCTDGGDLVGAVGDGDGGAAGGGGGGADGGGGRAATAETDIGVAGGGEGKRRRRRCVRYEGILRAASPSGRASHSHVICSFSLPVDLLFVNFPARMRIGLLLREKMEKPS